jgi:hypothetical protein
MVSQVNQACPVIIHRFHWTKKENAVGAHPDRTVLQVLPAPLDPLASKATPEPPAKWARTALKDHQAHPDQPAKKEKMASQARKENQAKMPNVETKDHQAHQAKPANPVQPVPQAKKAQPANQATKPTTARPAHLVKEANPETKDPPAHLARKAPRAPMPTTVLARVVPPPRPPPPRPPKSKKPHDPSKSIFKNINYRIQLGLTSAFNIFGDQDGKFFNPVLPLFFFDPTQKHASM